MSQMLAASIEERARVMTMAVVRAAEKLGLSGKDLATILGISEPPVPFARCDNWRRYTGFECLAAQ